jgi:glycosyltransferase involved in cell wall biosynthesis
MAAPILSVLLPNYNHGRYLKQCFAGLQLQTMRDFEVIITDDGSTDGSPDIIRSYAQNDPRFKPVYFPVNRGVTEACKDLFQRASGKYLYCGAADDFVINKDFFQRAVAVLDRDLRPAGFYGITGIYLAEKEKLVSSCSTAEVVGYNTPLQCAQGFIGCRGVIMTPSAIWRRDLYLKHGGADTDKLFPKMGPQVDFYLSHVLAFTYGMYYEKTPFACQRIFEAKTNYSANMHLWETASRYAELEKGLRAVGLDYPGVEQDWLRWRAFWMMDTIQKSGVRI